MGAPGGASPKPAGAVKTILTSVTRYFARSNAAAIGVLGTSVVAVMQSGAVGSVDAGDLAEQVIDVTLPAQFGHDAEVPDIAVIRRRGRDGEADELPVHRFRQPPPRSLAGA